MSVDIGDKLEVALAEHYHPVGADAELARQGTHAALTLGIESGAVVGIAVGVFFA